MADGRLFAKPRSCHDRTDPRNSGHGSVGGIGFEVHTQHLQRLVSHHRVRQIIGHTELLIGSLLNDLAVAALNAAAGAEPFKRTEGPCQTNVAGGAGW